MFGGIFCTSTVATSELLFVRSPRTIVTNPVAFVTVHLLTPTNTQEPSAHPSSPVALHVMADYHHQKVYPSVLSHSAPFVHRSATRPTSPDVPTAYQTPAHFDPVTYLDYVH